MPIANTVGHSAATVACEIAAAATTVCKPANARPIEPTEFQVLVEQPLPPGYKKAQMAGSVNPPAGGRSMLALRGT